MEDLLFYGGLGTAGVGLILLFILISIFGHQRRRLIKRIEDGEDIS